MVVRSEVAVMGRMGRMGRFHSAVRLGAQVEIENRSQHCGQADQDLNFLPEHEPEKKRESIAQAEEQVGGQDSDTKRNITSRLNLG